MRQKHSSSLKTPQKSLWSLIFKIDSSIGFVARLDSPNIDHFADCKAAGRVLIERTFRMTAQGGGTSKSPPSKTMTSKP